MPAAVVVGAMAATGATAAIGASIGAAIVGSAVSATTAAVIGSAVVGAGVTLASGGDASDALKGAVLGGITAGVGSAVSSTVTNALVDAGVNSAIAATAGGAASGAVGAALGGGDIEQGFIMGGLNAGFNQALDAAATALNTPSPNTDDLSFTLPDSIRTGLGAAADELADDYVMGGNYDVGPVDYSLGSTPKSNIPSGEPGLNPAGGYLGLTMDSVQGQAPGLASMGGGSGLSADASAPLGDPNSFINNPDYNIGMPQGTISAAGFTDESAMPALGDPTSFINNPDVTGKPVIPTPACAYNVNMPNVDLSDLMNMRQARQNRALCIAFGGFDMNIPWLNTRAQMLNARPANVGCASTANTGAKPGELTHIYDQITPELRDAFAQKGIGQPASAALSMPPLTLASGGSAETTCSTWGAMSKYMPKFHAATSPSLLQTARTQRQQPGLSQLKQMYANISQQGNMGGMARGGLPAKYHEAAPEGHNPEFITGLTGFYANGKGTGQSDDIPAMLHDGDYVMDADTVAALGDGSSKAGAQALESFRKEVPHRMSTGGKAVPAKIADGEYVFPEAFVTALGNGDNKRGAKMLDMMRENLRAHKRSAPTSKIPPKALSPLDYLKKAK